MHLSSEILTLNLTQNQRIFIGITTSGKILTLYIHLYQFQKIFICINYSELYSRIWYGNATHLNVSVVVGEDNKAVMYVALDRKDKDYFACDAGCLDAPVELGVQKQSFPVKITDPVTSILYITSDKRHAEELHFSIHVKEILEGKGFV